MTANKYKRNFRRKYFFSSELKKALFVSFNEAKKRKVYLTTEILLYGLLSNPKSISARLLSLTISQFRNNKSLTSLTIANQISQINHNSSNEKLNPISFEFSSKLWSENEVKPWLSPEVKDIFKKSINSALKTQNKVVIVTTRNLIFELLNKESIRNLIRQLVND